MKHFAGLVLCGVLGGAGPALAEGVVAASAVVDWNRITIDAVTVGRPGPIGVVDIALVQIAVHDAVQAIDKRFEPYHFEVKRASGSRSAAVAAAAHGVLVGMYPAQAATLDPIYHSYVADNGLTGDPGLEVGQQAAAGILPLRRSNPNPLPTFEGGNDPGQWRPTPSFLGNPPAPPPHAPMAAPWMGSFDPFTLTSPARFRPEPPPELTSERYTKDYNEVKALGSLTSTARSAEQTDLAYFYSGNIPGQWNNALRGIANRYVRKTGDQARLFALANMAMADAIISSWNSKVHYAFWRPITAIVHAEQDGNPNTAAEAGWQPLINTPNYPDYTSGANNVAGAMTRTLQLFFDADRVTFDITTLVPQAVRKTRTYRRFSDAADDMVEARILLGIHFRFADVAGRTQGQRVADWTFNHYLLPVRRH